MLLELICNRTNTEINATNYTGVHVFMQTLCLDVVGSHGNWRIRALIDSGSQRSYILRSTAEELDLSSKDKEIIVHCLFGGATSKQCHNMYKILIANRAFKVVKLRFSTNQKFVIM